MALSQTGAVHEFGEDVVEYHLIPDLSGLKLSNEQKADFLEEKQDVYLTYLSRHCADYIWHKDPFHLSVVSTSGAGSAPAHLFGRTCYGDNVEDEWFIVFLLIELSKTFPDLVIKVHDSDGEFLLIEAANHLPKWLNPDTATNRVFIYQGLVHVIPRQSEQAEGASLSSGVPSLGEAIAYIRKYNDRTVASNGIQQDIRNRIADYPEKKIESFHYTHCYIPAGLSAVLDHSPGLIAPIVQAFYHRDALDLKACVTFRHFRPGTRVMRQVKFTRCLYAQLVQQKFQPDRRSGYTLPPATNTKFRAYDLGMKLAHGAEILCSKYSEDDIKANNIEQMLKSDTRWQHFVTSLQEKGYFRGEIEGSKLYCKLLDEAKAYYFTTAKPYSSGTDIGHRILSTMKSVQFDLEQMRQQEKDLPQPDDDSWIEINPDQLDDMLNKLSGKNVTLKQDALNLEKVSESMKMFVEKISSHEGAEFPKGDGEDDDVQFDPNSFMQSMQKIFEFEDPESNSSSEMDEYESDDELGDSYAMRCKQKPGAGRPPGPPGAKSTGGGGGGKAPTRKGGKEAPTRLEVRDYMDLMDRELANTAVGQSFTREGDEYEELADGRPKPMPRKKKELKKQQQQQQTGANAHSSSSVCPTGRKPPTKALPEDIDDEDDDFRPVNVDLNMVKNLLESYGSQQGLPGPASNLLGSMGVQLPHNSDDL